MADQDGEGSGGHRSPTATRMILGGQLRRFRQAAGVTPADAGYRIRASRSKISRMENGQVGFKERDVADLLDLYGVTDDETRSGALALVALTNAVGWWERYDVVLPDWFAPYLGLESAATHIRCFEPQLVPGLFQTEGYARAVPLLGSGAESGEEIEELVALRLRRQSLLTRPDPPLIWAVLDEGVLRRSVGGRAVMRAQLDRLIEIAAMPQVTLQVLPFDRGGHAAGGGAFSMLRFSEPEVPDMVYVEQLSSAVYLDRREDIDLYAEVMGRLGALALTPRQTRGFLAEVRDET